MGPERHGPRQVGFLGHLPDIKSLHPSICFFSQTGRGEEGTKVIIILIIKLFCKDLEAGFSARTTEMVVWPRQLSALESKEPVPSIWAPQAGKGARA